MVMCLSLESHASSKKISTPEFGNLAHAMRFAKRIAPIALQNCCRSVGDICSTTLAPAQPPATPAAIAILAGPSTTHLPDDDNTVWFAEAD
jgi:hypothetical protein